MSLPVLWINLVLDVSVVANIKSHAFIEGTISNTSSKRESKTLYPDMLKNFNICRQPYFWREKDTLYTGDTSPCSRETWIA